MYRKFIKWWSVWGQLHGFLILVVSLNAFWMIFLEEMQQEGSIYPLIWIIMFFGGASWYSWQSKKHGWRLPKDIRNTHGW